MSSPPSSSSSASSQAPAPRNTVPLAESPGADSDPGIPPLEASTARQPAQADASPAAPARPQAFDRLHPKIQRWIWERQWTELRDIQEAAVAPILEGKTDVLIAAATARGKTEAAFLPVCTRLVEDSAGSIRALYLGPLKALINDQFERLEDLCKHLDIPVHRWHGDVDAGRKKQLMQDPGGVLLITPESLEALFVIHGPRLSKLFASLGHVVIDELHSFMGSARGRQLQSLLHRVELALRRRVPRVGLSATLGDMGLAADFLRPGKGPEVHGIVAGGGGQEVQLQIRGYRRRRPAAESDEPSDVDPSLQIDDKDVNPRGDSAAAGRGELVAVPQDGRDHRDFRPDGGKVIGDDVGSRSRSSDAPDAAPSDGLLGPEDEIEISQHLFSTLRGKNNLVFANQRQKVEVFADRLRRICDENRLPNEFWPHHGSLSKELREEAERVIKAQNQPVTLVCTSTLEMGVDIGSVASVAQVGAPPSVASLRQRLGRSGRRGAPAVLRIYVSEDEISASTPPQDALRAQLVQAIAMVRLLLEKWYEPPAAGALQLSTLVQQFLSVIAQFGGVRAADAWGALCKGGPFSAVDQAMFASLLKALGKAELITQSSDGTLLLGQKGERIVGHYSFYSAFASPDEYRLLHGGTTLGSLPIRSAVLDGSYLIFAGRRWRVLSVDAEHKVIELEPAVGGRPPQFDGASGQVHTRVRTEMFRIYSSDDEPNFLDSRGRDLLKEARQNFRRYGLGQRYLLEQGKDTLIFPWIGDVSMSTLGAQLVMRGLRVSKDALAITILKTRPEELRSHLIALEQAGPANGTELAKAVANKQGEKYDGFLGDALLNADYASRALDPPGAWEWIRRMTKGGPGEPPGAADVPSGPGAGEHGQERQAGE